MRFAAAITPGDIRRALRGRGPARHPLAAVERHYGASKAKELEGALKKRWTVDFQIADFPRVDGAHSIPFFSKLTLQEEARKIEAMQFDVEVNFIKLTRAS